jgi:SAM-dependent methyltransferase
MASAVSTSSAKNSLVIITPMSQIIRLVRSHGLWGLIRLTYRRVVLKTAAFLIRQAAPGGIDPYHKGWQMLMDLTGQMSGYSVLELGSRCRVGVHQFEGSSKHVGLDVNAGPNVDVVGDAHKLSTLLTEKFDVVYSISVFEHLVMPWKVILEINRVMNDGGLLYISTHPCWPSHALPWDFYRFEREAFRGLLNRATGFEILFLAEGLPAAILPLVREASTRGLELEPVNLGVTVLARKIGSAGSELSWNVDLSEFLESHYPESGHSYL